jgi:hypothetical protein
MRRFFVAPAPLRVGVAALGGLFFPHALDREDLLSRFGWFPAARKMERNPLCCFQVGFGLAEQIVHE